MTARELFEWSAFERVFGPVTVQERVDVAGAMGAYATAAAAGAKDVRPDDFLPDWSRALQPKRQQTPEEMMAVVRGLMKPKPKGV